MAGSSASDRVLVIMAKAPRPGVVKTRLASSLSPEAATDFYCCLLEDTLALARSLGDVDVAIMCPESDVNELEQMAGNEVSVVAQKGEGLAAALTSVFAHFARGHQRRMIAFNSDSPHLPRSVLEGAFDMLAAHDVVVGPTHDGGYYLVGAKDSHPALFAHDGMGTSSALEKLLSRAGVLELSIGFAAPFYDIDVADDLTRLAEELRLAPERAPRTARWLEDWASGNTVPDGHGRIVAGKITSAWRVYLLGATVCAALTICARNFADRGGPGFMTSLAIAGIAYLLAIREFFATPQFERRISRRLVVIGLVLAAAWHVEFLRLSAGADDDIHRYLWDGRVQRLGYNPYVVVPNDPALAGLHTSETRTLNNPYLPSPYPAGAQLFFRAVTAIHESIFALKVAFVLCDLAIVLILLDLLSRSRQGAHWVLAYAWNPLLAIDVAGSGHIDVVGVLLLLVSASALVRRWRAAAALAFGLAVAVKFLPIVLLPLYWKRVRVRDGALAVVVVALLYVPFFNHGRIPAGSLGTYLQSFRFNDPVFAALERLASPRLIAGLAASVGLLTAFLLRKKSEMLSPDAFAWPMAASLFCAPVIYPWYLLWLLPFLRSASTVPIIVWTVSIVPTYYVWHLRAVGRPWVLPGWIMLLEYGSVAAAGVLIALHRPATGPTGQGM